MERGGFNALHCITLPLVSLLPPRLLPQVILRLNELVWKYNIFPLDRLVLCFVRERKGGEGRGRKGGEGGGRKGGEGGGREGGWCEML